MTEQAKELVPPDMKDFEKNYIVKTLGDFTLKAGEALYNDESLNLTPEQAVFITQVIAEWSFHKSVDLIHSGILPEYWDSIMQKIAFTIFEVAKQAFIRRIPQDQMLQAVEHHVVKVYKQSIEELQEKGVIDEEVKNRAENQSNIDAMAKQVQEEQAKMQQQAAEESARMAEEVRKQKEEARAKERAERGTAKPVNMGGGVTHKQLRLMTLAMVLKVLSQDKVTTILNKFEANDSKSISQYMNMADLESQLNGDLVVDYLKEMKEVLPIKRKLTKENVVLDLINLYKIHSRERIASVIKKERPLVKRFVAQAYDGEYGELPLKIAGIVTEYIEENI
jgi:hypothetical protein